MEVPKSKLLKSANQKKSIVIFCDASFDSETNLGAWYCYIRVGEKVAQTGKIITSGITNSTEAERVGVANTLWLVDKMENLSKFRLIIHSDNLASVNPVRPSNKTGKQKQRAKVQLEFYQKNIEPILQKASAVDIRYIKGHADRRKGFRLKSRHLAHDVCDKEAKKILDKYKENLLKNNDKCDTIK